MASASNLKLLQNQRKAPYHNFSVLFLFPLFNWISLMQITFPYFPALRATAIVRRYIRVGFQIPHVGMDPVLGFREASPASLLSPETSYSGPQVRA